MKCLTCDTLSGGVSVLRSRPGEHHCDCPSYSAQDAWAMHVAGFDEKYRAWMGAIVQRDYDLSNRPINREGMKMFGLDALLPGAEEKP